MQVWEAGRSGVHYLSSLPVAMTVTCGRLLGVVFMELVGAWPLVRILGDSGNKSYYFVHLCKAPESNTIDSGAIQINCIIIIYGYIPTSNNHRITMVMQFSQDQHF